MTFTETLQDSILVERLFLASVELCALAALVWFATKLGKLRSHRVVSVLWLLVLIKPIASLTVGSPIGVPVMDHEQERPPTQSAELDPVLALPNPSPLPPSDQTPTVSDSGAAFTPEFGSFSREEQIPVMAANAPVLPAESGTGIRLSAVFQWTWIAGCLLFLGWHVVNRWRLWKLGSSSVEASDAIFESYSRAAASLGLGLSSLPRIRVSSQLDSPAIAGVFRPIIFLPEWLARSGNREELDWALRHELTHWKWKDPLAIGIRDVAVTLFFFHPAAWLASRQLVEALEKACDRAMLRRASEAQHYANGLHSLLEKMRRHKRPAIVGGLFATRTQVGRRLETLLSYARGNRLYPQLNWRSGLLLAAMTVCVAMLGAVIGEEKREGLYEEAPSVDAGKSIKIGPNRFEIDLIEPDPGAIHIQWSPESNRYDVIELRIFDSATNELVAGIGEDGRQLADGIHAEYTDRGARLEAREDAYPEKIDLWMRLHSYDRPLPEQVKADVGYSAEFGESKITTVQMMVGIKPYTTKRGQDGTTVVEFSNDDSLRFQEDTATTVVFRLRGEPPEGRFQVCAVDKGGVKYWPSTPHYVDLHRMGDAQVITFPVNAAALSHFEWRPYGGRHRFYFKDVPFPRQAKPTARTVMQRLQGTWLDPAYHPDHWHHFTESGAHIRVTGTAGYRRDEGSVRVQRGGEKMTLILDNAAYHLTWKTIDQLELRRVGREDVVKTLFRAGKRGVPNPDPVLALALEETISKAKQETIRVAGTWAVFDADGNQKQWVRFHNHGSVVGVDVDGEAVFSLDTWRYRNGELAWKTPVWSSFELEWTHKDAFRADEKVWRRAGTRNIASPDREVSKALNVTRTGQELTQKTFRRFLDLALAVDGDDIREALGSLARNQWTVIYLHPDSTLMRVKYTNGEHLAIESGKTLVPGGMRGTGGGRPAGEHAQEIKRLLSQLGQAKVHSLSSEEFPGVLFSFVEPNHTIKIPSYTSPAAVLSGADTTGFVCLVTKNLERPGEWGMATDELRMRIRADRDAYKGGERMLFWLDVENIGERPLEVNGHMLASLFTIEVDGELYRRGIGLGTTALVSGQPATEMLPPGKSIIDIPLVVDDQWMADDTPNLRLEPGKHKIRVRQPILHSGRWIEEGKAWTNPLTFEVIP